MCLVFIALIMLLPLGNSNAPVKVSPGGGGCPQADPRNSDRNGLSPRSESSHCQNPLPKDLYFYHL